jgi:hypothetical protein
VLTEVELDRIANTVDGSVEVHPLARTLTYVSSTCQLRVTARGQPQTR